MLLKRSNMGDSMRFLSSLVKETVGIEKEYSLGRLNLRWCNTTFWAWVLSLVLGFSFTLAPVNPKNYWEGFIFRADNSAPWYMTLLLVIVPLICGIGLLILKRKGYIDKDDY